MKTVYTPDNVFCDECPHFPHIGVCTFASKVEGEEHPVCKCEHNETSPEGIALLERVNNPEG